MDHITKLRDERSTARFGFNEPLIRTGAVTLSIQVVGKLLTHFRMFKRERNGGLEIAYLGSAIVTYSRKFIRQRPLFLQQRGDTVRKLDFPTRAWRDSFQMLKNFGSEDVAAYHAQG